MNPDQQCDYAQYVQDLEDQNTKLVDALKGLLPYRTAPQMGDPDECWRRIKVAQAILKEIGKE